MVQISALQILPERNYECTNKSVKTLTIVNGFRPESEKLDFGETWHHWKGHLKRCSYGTNVSFVAPSSEEIGARKEIGQNTLLL